MDAPLRPPVAVVERPVEPPVERTAEAEAFVARLAKEHERFLAAFADARQVLEHDPGQLAALAAVQGRLTRQFFDAQRSLLRRRAETDVKVLAIGADAASEADAVLAAARDEVRARMLLPPSTLRAPDASARVDVTWDDPVRSATPFGSPPPRDVFLSGPIPIAGGARPAPGDLTGLGTAAVGSAADADALQQVIDDAFASAEPDGAAAERQLRELLDAWWHAEQQEERAALDDATARAAMQLHIARVRAAEIARPAPPGSAPSVRVLPPPPAAPVGPATDPIVAALDGADPARLDEILASLLDGMPVTPTHAAALAAPTPGSLVSAEPPTTTSVRVDTEITQDEAFARFWGPGQHDASSTPTRRRRWIFPQLLVPAATVVVVLALLMALVG